MNSQTPFYFIGPPQNLYYDVNKGGPLVSKAKAAARLLSYGICDSDSAAMELLEQAALVPVSQEQLEAMRKKGKAQPLDWEAVYAEMQKLFPIYSRVTAKGERQIYFCDAMNQVSLVHYEDDDSLINSLMHNKALWKSLRAFYNDCELLAQHKAQLDFRTFMVKIIKNHLLLDETRLIDEQPKNFSWDPAELAFKKFDPALVAPGNTPTWDEFCNRLNYPDVFKAWVWSLFEPTNNIRQAMWITGAGNDGKSAVQKALREIFGAQHVYDCKKGDEGRQWFQSNVFGKCLVNYADCDNPHLLNNQAIKQLTGGDSTSIEAKGANAFSAEIYAKLFVSSNITPKINPDLEAQTSRLIRLKLAPIAKGAPKDEQFKSRLVDEAYAFLWQCKKEFEAMINAGNDALILPEQLQKDIIDECAVEQYYTIQEFVSKHVEFSPEYTCKPSQLNKVVKAFALLDQHMGHDKAGYFYTAFLAKLDHMGIRVQRIWENDQQIAAYVGIRLVNTEGLL